METLNLMKQTYNNSSEDLKMTELTVSQTMDGIIMEFSHPLDSIKESFGYMEAAGPHAMDKYLQFERNGYYHMDSDGDWNRTLPMRDGYKINKK